LQAASFMAALAAGEWQVGGGAFMLGPSVARCGYFEV